MVRSTSGSNRGRQEPALNRSYWFDGDTALLLSYCRFANGMRNPPATLETSPAGCQSCRVADLLGGAGGPLGAALLAVDLDSARLHRLGHDAPEANTEQAVLQAGTLHLDEVRQLEPAFERSH